MEFLPCTSLRCMLCSGGVGEGDWSKKFKAVFLMDNRIHIGDFYYNKSFLFQQVSILGASDQQIRLRLIPASNFTAAEAFLIHSSCYCLFQDTAKSEIYPSQLFKLCQSLQPDRERNFAYEKDFELLGCLNPCFPLIPSSSLHLPTKINLMINNTSSSTLLQLPVEIVMMVLKALPPSRIITFFRSSKQALRYAGAFFSQNLLQFYRCTTTGSDVGLGPMLMLRLFSKFPHACCPELDKRWELISEVTFLASYISKVPEHFIAPTLDVRAPCRSVDCPFGFKELIAEIPVDIKAIKVYMVELRGKLYVSGLRLETETTHELLGNQSKIFSEFDVSHIEVNTIKFLVDSLGLRDLWFGDSLSSSRHANDTQCWEGFSTRQEDRFIRIVQDTLKFRQINWRYSDQPPFAESILMREKHAFWHGYISNEDFVQQNPHDETQLVAQFGNFPTETVWLDQDLRGITMYHALSGIEGITTHTSSGSSCAGRESGRAIFFPVHGPHEVLTEIEVHLRPEYLAITLRTNWHRQCLFGSAPAPGTLCTTRTLRPPVKYHIKGLYFRLGMSVIQSLGPIYAAGSHGTACPSIRPPLTIPRLSPRYGLENDSFFESGARLSGIQRIWFYYDSNHCTGLRLFYPFGNSEVVGRIQGDHSHELISTNGNAICWIWLIHEEGRLKELGFETENTKGPREGSHQITESTALAWLYSDRRGVICIFQEGSARTVVYA